MKKLSIEVNSQKVSDKSSGLLRRGSSINDALEHDFDAARQKHRNLCLKLLCIFSTPRTTMVKEEILNQIMKLNSYCLTHYDDYYNVHVKRLKGLEVLNDILDRSKMSDMTTTQVVCLIWCNISCVHHFYIRLRVADGFFGWRRK
ncbi:hypothetical protein FQR65_LT03884 [Abscondita terminalis]|nr:hypothetical protein FQR65_LT03884 [Abscondita terminalis]